MDKNNTNPHYLSKTEETERTTRNGSARGNTYSLDRYILDNNKYEKIAISEPSNKREAEEQLRRFNQKWESASKRSN
ncbi:uncharacterized protein F4807DRAFT_414223 [Annulohypoxylon truncatum]|uniref:uncharacterized protein n=1 Tax=Annulohypoxylon truncatum TaxID=327061 RepID=UPI00200839B8|nr:uncharacterized protein F4807DRAFT_414223 [Annulohypoxylon truncatum]KAI1212718.1 hypothetical protein F4807DRAFT_414223 [Annulohypoxylon truncatum]